MTVYVDQFITCVHGTAWCRLTADSEAELHEFATRLGLPSDWFQSATPGGIACYRITREERQRALGMGGANLPKTLTIRHFNEFARRCQLDYPGGLRRDCPSV